MKQQLENAEGNVEITEEEVIVEECRLPWSETPVGEREATPIWQKGGERKIGKSMVSESNWS